MGATRDEVARLRAVLERIEKRATGPSWEDGDDPMDDAATCQIYAVDLAAIGEWAHSALAKKEEG